MVDFVTGERVADEMLSKWIRIVESETANFSNASAQFRIPMRKEACLSAFTSILPRL